MVSYLFQGSPMNSLNFDVMDFVRDTFSRGSQYGTNSWYLTSVQAGFEPWIGGVGLTVNSFSAIGRRRHQQPAGAGHPGHADARPNVTANSVDAELGRLVGHGQQLPDRAGHRRHLHHLQPGRHLDQHRRSPTPGLAANTTYRYRVRATNSAGNSGYSGIVNVTTTERHDTQPPGTPGTPTRLERDRARRRP